MNTQNTNLALVIASLNLAHIVFTFFISFPSFANCILVDRLILLRKKDTP